MPYRPFDFQPQSRRRRDPLRSVSMRTLNGNAIFPTLALAKRRLAKLYFRLWRWRNIDQQSYLPYVGASKRCKLTSLLWR